jgi:hypothetical protein
MHYAVSRTPHLALDETCYSRSATWTRPHFSSLSSYCFLSWAAAITVGDAGTRLTAVRAGAETQHGLSCRICDIEVNIGWSVFQRLKNTPKQFGADGVHVGTLDRVEGDRIKPTKNDSGEGSHKGHHHYVSHSLAATVEGDTVRLSANADVAITFEEER